MPSGVPVATVALNGAKNAGILAAQILGANDEKISKKIADYKKSLLKEVEEKFNKLEKVGYNNYLKQK